MQPDAQSEPRCLGLSQSTALVVGNMIGVGIFLMPGLVAQHTMSSVPFIAVWFCGGLWALFGALSFAELGTLFPKAGGDYVFLREAYGKPWAFVSGWLALLVTFPGSIAIMSLLTMRYQGSTFLGGGIAKPLVSAQLLGWNLNVSGAHLLAVAMILLLTWLNHRSTRWSAWLQLALTALPVLLLVLLVAGVYVVATGVSNGGAVNDANASALSGSSNEVPSFRMLVLAFFPVYFAYTGWNAISYAGGEVKKPSRNIPLALLIGTLSVTLFYLVVCLAYVRVIPVSEMVSHVNVGAAVVAKMLGPWSVVLVDGLIFVVVFGTVNVTILGGGRIYLAMARDGVFLKGAGTLHPKYKTPTNGLWIQGGWACVLVFVASVEQLLDYTVSAMVFLSTMAVAAVIVLRYRRPQLKRPYKTWGYPVTPVLYIVFSLLVLWGSLHKEPAWAQLIGVGLGALGFIVYGVAAKAGRIR